MPQSLNDCKTSILISAFHVYLETKEDRFHNNLGSDWDFLPPYCSSAEYNVLQIVPRDNELFLNTLGPLLFLPRKGCCVTHVFYTTSWAVRINASGMLSWSTMLNDDDDVSYISSIFPFLYLICHRIQVSYSDYMLLWIINLLSMICVFF